MNLIHLVEGALTKHTCEKLIYMFEANVQRAKPGKAGENNLDNLEMILKIAPGTDPWEFWGLGKALAEAKDDFIQKYPLMNECLERWHLDENIHLCKFEHGAYYKQIHCENTGLKQYQNRAFAWMIYLNDIEEGGETEFIFQKFKTSPKAGNFYIWPAGSSHMHRGVPSYKRPKYFLTGWFNFLES